MSNVWVWCVVLVRLVSDCLGGFVKIIDDLIFVFVMVEDCE